MERKLYVSNMDLLDKKGYMGSTPLQIEEWAKENNLHFEEDDMGNCYISEDEECEVFDEVYGFYID